MKQTCIGIILFVVLGWILFFPKKQNDMMVHQSKQEIDSYQVRLEGAFNISRTFVFFEPKSVDEILKMGYGYTDTVDLSQFTYSEMIGKNRVFNVKSVQIETEPSIQKININQANFKTLISIPHMTESRAAALIIYREAHGKFNTIDDLIHVKYIGTSTLEKIRPYIFI